MYALNNMRIKPPFNEMAKEYGVKIARSKSDSVISISCPSALPIDIGFMLPRRRSLLQRLHIVRPVTIHENLCCYGPGATSLAKAMSSDQELCSALLLLLQQFRSKIAWSHSTLYTHLSPYVAESDASGGERFLDNFSLTATSLKRLAGAGIDIDATRDGRGPRFIRRISSALFAVLGAVISVTVFYMFNIPH